MTKKRVLTFFTFFFFFLNFQCVIAQGNQEDKILLSKLVPKIQKQFDVVFSYVDNTLDAILVTPPTENTSLENLLDGFESETNLRFTIINGRYIAITVFKDQIQELDEVYLTEYIASGISTNRTGQITIKPKNFSILPGVTEPDVLLTIQALPGISSINETVSNINIRGGTNDQNILLWDNIKMYQSGHFFGLISAFNPYFLKKVTVTKNGTSAQHGDGVSGMIQMELDAHPNDSLIAGAGMNLIHIDGFAKVQLNKKMEVQVSARRSITDLVETPTYAIYFDRIFQDSDITNNNQATNNTTTTNRDFYFYDMSTKFIYDISKTDNLQFSFLNIFNDLSYTEEATLNNQRQAVNSGITQRNFATGLTYTREWSPAFSTQLQFYTSNYNLEATNFNITDNQRLFQENDLADSAIKLHTKYRINENFTIESGYQFSEIGITNIQDVSNPQFRSDRKEVMRNHAVYSEVHYFSDSYRTMLTFGIRGNRYGKIDTFRFEPRLNFRQQFSNHFSLLVLGEYKSQAISQVIDLQNDFLGIEKRRWTLANGTSVPLIESKQASVGVQYNKNNLLITAEAYVKDVDGITTRSQGFQNQFQFVNAVGSYTTHGIDVLFNKKWHDFNTWLSYSLSKNDYEFTSLNNGEQFPNNLDITHNLTLGGTYSWNDFEFSLGTYFRTGRPTTSVGDPSVVNGEINYNSPNAENLEDYFRTDFSTTYRLTLSKKKKIYAKIGLSVWNIFDQQNVLNEYYNLDNQVVSQIQNRALGITPNLSFRVDF
ncbi:putative outer membrane protein probably involved in nutrient binding [Kordia algicida OT-1]|uniref:Putative outer membrane protein probably involved in nutrient binding n=1 Tax=Kordia algicida OT-1 TaxID=391587 RepID=A9DIG4_9FLAO|nr:putative outer membrane protein probably involved in nutrient binding [Kordia algicida OT-1]